MHFVSFSALRELDALNYDSEMVRKQRSCPKKLKMHQSLPKYKMWNYYSTIASGKNPTRPAISVKSSRKENKSKKTDESTMFTESSIPKPDSKQKAHKYSEKYAKLQLEIEDIQEEINEMNDKIDLLEVEIEENEILYNQSTLKRTQEQIKLTKRKRDPFGHITAVDLILLKQECEQLKLDCEFQRKSLSNESIKELRDSNHDSKIALQPIINKSKRIIEEISETKTAIEDLKMSWQYEEVSIQREKIENLRSKLRKEVDDHQKLKESHSKLTAQLKEIERKKLAKYYPSEIINETTLPKTARTENTGSESSSSFCLDIDESPEIRMLKLHLQKSQMKYTDTNDRYVELRDKQIAELMAFQKHVETELTDSQKIAIRKPLIEKKEPEKEDSDIPNQSFVDDQTTKNHDQNAIPPMWTEIITPVSTQMPSLATTVNVSENNDETEIEPKDIDSEIPTKQEICYIQYNKNPEMNKRNVHMKKSPKSNKQRNSKIVKSFMNGTEDYRQISIKNLPESTTKQQLHELFEPYGTIKHILIESDGNAIILYKNPSMAHNAAEKMNGKRVENNKIEVKISMKPEIRKEIVAVDFSNEIVTHYNVTAQNSTTESEKSKNTVNIDSLVHSAIDKLIDLNHQEPSNEIQPVLNNHNESKSEVEARKSKTNSISDTKILNNSPQKTNNLLDGLLHGMIDKLTNDTNETHSTVEGIKPKSQETSKNLPILDLQNMNSTKQPENEQKESKNHKNEFDDDFADSSSNHELFSSIQNSNIGEKKKEDTFSIKPGFLPIPMDTNENASNQSYQQPSTTQIKHKRSLSNKSQLNLAVSSERSEIRSDIPLPMKKKTKKKKSRNMTHSSQQDTTENSERSTRPKRKIHRKKISRQHSSEQIQAQNEESIAPSSSLLPIQNLPHITKDEENNSNKVQSNEVNIITMISNANINEKDKNSQNPFDSEIKTLKTPDSLQINKVKKANNHIESEAPIESIDQKSNSVIEVDDHKSESSTQENDHKSDVPIEVDAHKSESSTQDNDHKSDVPLEVDDHKSESSTQENDHKTDVPIEVDDHNSDVPIEVDYHKSESSSQENDHKTDVPLEVDDHKSESSSQENDHKSDVPIEGDAHKSDVPLEVDDHKSESSSQENDHKSDVPIEVDDHKSDVPLEVDDHKSESSSQENDHKSDVPIEGDAHKSDVPIDVDAHKSESSTQENDHKSDVPIDVDAHKSESSTQENDHKSDVPLEVDDHKSESSSQENDHKSDVPIEVDDHKSDVPLEVDDHKSESSSQENDHKSDVPIEGDAHKSDVPLEVDDHKSDVPLEVDDHKSESSSQDNDHKSDVPIEGDAHKSDVPIDVDAHKSESSTQENDYKSDVPIEVDDHKSESSTKENDHKSESSAKENDHKSDVPIEVDDHNSDVPIEGDAHKSDVPIEINDHKSESSAKENDHKSDVPIEVDDHNSDVPIEVDDHKSESSTKENDHRSTSMIEVQEHKSDVDDNNIKIDADDSKSDSDNKPVSDHQSADLITQDKSQKLDLTDQSKEVSNKSNIIRVTTEKAGTATSNAISSHADQTHAVNPRSKRIQTKNDQSNLSGIEIEEDSLAIFDNLLNRLGNISQNYTDKKNDNISSQSDKTKSNPIQVKYKHKTDKFNNNKRRYVKTSTVNEIPKANKTKDNCSVSSSQVSASSRSQKSTSSCSRKSQHSSTKRITAISSTSSRRILAASSQARQNHHSDIEQKDNMVKSKSSVSSGFNFEMNIKDDDNNEINNQSDHDPESNENHLSTKESRPLAEPTTEIIFNENDDIEPNADNEVEVIISGNQDKQDDNILIDNDQFASSGSIADDSVNDILSDD